MGRRAVACVVARAALDKRKRWVLAWGVTVSSNSRERKKRGTPSLGRERAAVTVERVQHIVRLMVAREWHDGMDKELAKEWGISDSRVRQLSAEASRFVRFATGDTSDIRNRLIVEILECLDEAKQCGKLGDRIYAVQVAARDLGIVVPKLEADVRTGEIAKLSDEELLQRLREEAARLEEKIKAKGVAK